MEDNEYPLYGLDYAQQRKIIFVFIAYSSEMVCGVFDNAYAAKKFLQKKRSILYKCEKWIQNGLDSQWEDTLYIEEEPDMDETVNAGPIEDFWEE